MPCSRALGDVDGTSRERTRAGIIISMGVQATLQHHMYHLSPTACHQEQCFTLAVLPSLTTSNLQCGTIGLTISTFLLIQLAASLGHDLTVARKQCILLWVRLGTSRSQTISGSTALEQQAAAVGHLSASHSCHSTTQLCHASWCPLVSLFFTVLGTHTHRWKACTAHACGQATGWRCRARQHTHCEGPHSPRHPAAAAALLLAVR